MTSVPYLYTPVNELFAIEQLLATPAQALAWMDGHIELVTLTKKPGTAEHIARLKLSLASSDQESAAFATLTVVRLIEAQAAWLQGKLLWSAIGRSGALKEVVAAIRDSLTSAEDHEAIKASFLSEHRKVTERIEEGRSKADMIVSILSDQPFKEWVVKTQQLKQKWNRDLLDRCGNDVDRWVLVVPNSLKIMVSVMEELRRKYDTMLVRPTARRQPVKNPGSAARRHPRIAKSETSSTETATANSEKGPSAKATKAKSNRG